MSNSNLISILLILFIIFPKLNTLYFLKVEIFNDIFRISGNIVDFEGLKFIYFRKKNNKLQF
ncbi:MAG TPA: hypothetical protein DFI01_10075 [Bacteroidales bacterium]|nr:hypothetical protein [Bacteroidales bacterium]